MTGIAKQTYRYTISWEYPNSHVFTVRLEAEKGNGKFTYFSIPAWRPGRYFTQNFGSMILDFKAYDENGNEIKCHKTDKDTWAVHNPDTKKIVVEYRVIASWVDAGSTYLNENIFYVNPVNCLMYVNKNFDAPAYLTIESLPDNWKIAIALPKTGDKTWFAESYHRLVDSPFFASENIITLHEKVLGKDIYLHFRGKYELGPADEKKLLHNVKRIVEEATAVFGELPVDEYHFLYLLVPFYIRHAVEHSYCAIFVLPDGVASLGSGFSSAYAITSHEFFHLWNVKRIRPQALLPYDYSREMYTGLHWFTEGVTDYYADLLLVRAGIWKPEKFIETLQATFNRLEKSYASKIVSPERSSMDSWLEMSMYKTQLNRISYYPLGYRIGFSLDILLRKESDNKVSLDDVMAYLYENYYKKGKGVPERGIQEVCKKLLPEKKDKIQWFFETFVYGTAPYPWEKLYSECDMEITKTPDYNSLKSIGILETKDHPQGKEIIRISPDADVLSSGISPTAVITKINGYDIEYLPNNWIQKLKPNQKVSITFIKDGNPTTSGFIYTGNNLIYNWTLKTTKSKIFKKLFASKHKEVSKVER